MTKFNFPSEEERERERERERENNGGRHSGFKCLKIINQVCDFISLMTIVWLGYQVHEVALNRIAIQSLMANNDSLKRKTITVIISLITIITKNNHNPNNNNSNKKIGVIRINNF